MKITIIYERNTDGLFKCCAKTKFNDVTYLAVGDTYEDARRSLIEKVKAAMDFKIPTPEPEEVEIEADGSK